MKTLVIDYPFRWGGQFKDKFWQGIIEGEAEVYDFNTKESLIADAEKDGMAWKVLRHHKNGKVSIIDSSEKRSKK